MTRLSTFIRAARQSLAFAVYDMRFSDPLKASLSSALRERAAAVGGSDHSREFPGTAPADIPVVVPLDAVRGRRVPGPGHGSGHAHARLAA